MVTHKHFTKLRSTDDQKQCLADYCPGEVYDDRKEFAGVMNSTRCAVTPLYPAADRQRAPPV